MDEIGLPKDHQILAEGPALWRQVVGLGNDVRRRCTFEGPDHKIPLGVHAARQHADTENVYVVPGHARINGQCHEW